MKALILAAGKGKRLCQVTSSLNKCMLEVKGKPLLSYNLELASNFDVDEIIIVVGYKSEQIINYFGYQYNEKRIRYAVQAEQKGIVNAIECATDYIGQDDFILFHGDEILVEPRIVEMVSFLHTQNLFAVCGAMPVDDMELIKKTYTIDYSGQNKITRLVEKPVEPLNSLMGTGYCVFRNHILSYIDETPVNPVKNEKDLTDLIQCAINDGKDVRWFIVGKNTINVNYEKDIIDVGEMVKSF